MDYTNFFVINYIIPIPINFGNFMYVFYLHELYFYYIFLTDCFYLF